MSMHSDPNSEANSGNSESQPLVTVVIPFFNRSNCISRTLQSVLHQCYTNWEALIVDDGSSTEEREQLLALVEQLGDDRFRVLVQAENCGGGAARNVGMLAARGQYIALLDSDDEWASGKLEAQVRLHAGSDAMLVSYTRSVIDFGGVRGRQAPMPEHAIGSHSVADYLFYAGGFMPTPSLFGSADVFKKRLFDESLRRHQDYDFLLSLEAFGCQFEMLHEVLVTIHWEDVGTAAGKRFYCPEVSEQFIADRPAMFSRRAAAAFRLNNVFAPRRQEEGLLPGVQKTRHSVNVVGMRRGAGYNEKRNFGKFFNQHRRVRDLGHFAGSLAFRLTGRGYQPIWQGFFFRPFDKMPLHSFNTVPLQRRKFLVHFETSLPRLGSDSFWVRHLKSTMAKRLAGPSCVGILALSETARNIFQADYGQKWPQYLSEVEQKLHVLHPPQPAMVSSELLQNKFVSIECIQLCFVGRDFARKGGIELLEALSSCRETLPDWHLTIVSQLNLQDYATQLSGELLEKSRLRVAQYLSEMKSHITLIDSLPHERVMDLMKGMHVGLLPTWADSYGYSCLEFQAAGCPVISTDIRALPEINNADCGWVIEVPKQAHGVDAALETLAERRVFSKRLEQELATCLAGILEPGSSRDATLQSKAQAALERIKSQHDPVAHGEQLAKFVDALEA